MPSSSGIRSIFHKLRSSFRSRFVIGDNYSPYIPPTRQEHKQFIETHTNNIPNFTDNDLSINVYRYPSPASQSKPEIPLVPSETVYDIGYYKRANIKLVPPEGAKPKLFYQQAVPGHQGIHNYPRHISHPWWYYNLKALKEKRKFYIESGGLVAIGLPKSAKYNKQHFKQVGADRNQLKNIQI